jgi:uncharacterized protein with HEPN domain
LPATAAQVFGPNTVDPGFNSTGEKTLLTMSTTLPAGGKNVIIVTFGKNGDLSPEASGTFSIKKGNTILYETTSMSFNYDYVRPKHVLLVAIDSNPSGNDSYSFSINITSAGGSTGSVHVQGIVIKTDDAVWGYNTTAVSINNGATGTVVSVSSVFPANSKVAIVAVFYAGTQFGAPVSAGYIKLKSGTVVISSNQFSISSYVTSDPIWMGLAYLDVPTVGNQTYSIEFTNNSGVTASAYAEIVAFTVDDGTFLDTGSVSLTSGSQVTVGNLSTSLSGNVVVIGLAAVINTSNAGHYFNTNGVVLQLNNSSTGQIGNLVRWYVNPRNTASDSGILPLFRFDIGVSNPSYQIKMTATQSGINGEAKILAFVLGSVVKKVFSETLQLLENTILGRGRFRSVTEQINLLENNVLSRMWIRVRDETINLVDAFQRAMSKFRHALEGLNIFESVSAFRGRVLQISEMVRVSEIVTRVRQRFREVVEDINLNEALLASRGVVRVFGEFVNLLENVVRSKILNRVVNETERLVESFVLALGKVVGVIESVRLLELTLASRMRVRISDELVRLSEAFSKSMSMIKTITEQVRLLEAFKVLSNKFRSVVESVRIDEFPSLVVGKFRSFIETVRIGEVFNRFRGAVRQVVEVVNIGEITSRLSNLFRSVVESVRIEEFVRGMRDMFIRVLESVNVIESITLSRIFVRIRDEIIDVGELFSSFIGRVKVVVENVRIVERFSPSIFKIYIKRLKSILRGMTKSGLEGSSKGGEL